ncbi:MAG: hypothetical protein ACKVRP_02490 [Bacteroidota bacterium]
MIVSSKPDYVLYHEIPGKKAGRAPQDNATEVALAYERLEARFGFLLPHWCGNHHA